MNRNRKASDGILQCSSLWFMLGLRRWSLKKQDSHKPWASAGWCSGWKMAGKYFHELVVPEERKRPCIGFLFYFFYFVVVSWQLLQMRKWSWEGKSLFLALQLIKGSCGWADFTCNSWSEDTCILSLSLFFSPSISLSWQCPMRQTWNQKPTVWLRNLMWGDFKFLMNKLLNAARGWRKVVHIIKCPKASIRSFVGCVITAG